MTATPQPPQYPLGSPANEVTQEVRFAVVMYGGVSLCIYINGVAQELLELSRVTAFGPNGELLHSPKGAGAIYRRIGQYLDSDVPDSTLLKKDSQAKVRTRFVVDVLSGTSAGGLNSLFLAKALANDQNMEGLRNLWMHEADITRLLNDKESVRGEVGLKDPSKPASLLNSQRMFKKLLTALDEMDFPPSGPGGQGPAPAGDKNSPHVNELDCYITATDLAGLPIQLKLQNAVATEQRYRNVFRFRYRGPTRNDFKSENNPFLAFAGRCTSAFPFAFEPMQLADIDEVLPCWPRYYPPDPERKAIREKWERFYREYTDAGCDFDHRSFGDGGYLDNKPFSYATRTLMRRKAVLPVRRKLIYVEPSPEHFATGKGSTEKPDFISNSLAALISLPRYETIREDIQAVLDRNGVLDIVSQLTLPVDRDVRLRNANRAVEENPLPYEKRGLRERMDKDGLGYGTYHRLRVVAVTHALADMIARASGFNTESNECLAIRWIIETWRDAMFAEQPEAGSKPFEKEGDAFPAAGSTRPRSSQNSFLSAFDIDYRLRRIFFLQRRIGELLQVVAGTAGSASPDALAGDQLIATFLPLVDEKGEQKSFSDELRAIKRDLAEPLGHLVNAPNALFETDEIAGMLAQLLIGPDFDEMTNLQRRQRVASILLRALNDPIEARQLYKTHEKEFDLIARKIAQKLEESFAIARAGLDKILPKQTPGENVPLPKTPAEAARAALRPIVDQFDDYDAVIFPIQYGASATEANRVDIIRISPPDAPNLIDEQTDPRKRRKLAGTAVFSFGAFLARFWRENDMLWGRLDAAEVLIRSLLRDTTAAQQEPLLVNALVEEAQTKILSETLTEAQREELWSFICEAFAATSESRAKIPPSQTQIRSAVIDLLKEFPDLDQRLRAVLRFAGETSDEQLTKYFQNTYEVRRRLAVAEQLRTVSRAGLIVSRMLNTLAAEGDNSLVKKHVAILPRVAAIVWGLVEISLPHRLGYGLWQVWRYRFYVAGVCLLLAGLIWQPAILGGLGVIGLTLVVDSARWWVGDIVRNTGRLRVPFTWILILLGLLVIVLATWKTVDLWHLIHPRSH